MFRTIIFLALTVSIGLLEDCPLIAADSPLRSLLRVGQPPNAASFVGCNDDGAFRFRQANKSWILARQELVRWGAPKPSLVGSEAILADGSRLVLAAAWTKAPIWLLADETVTIRTQSLGTIRLPRQELGAVVLNAPADEPRRLALVDQLMATPRTQDRVILDNGDLLEGKLQFDGDQLDSRANTIRLVLDDALAPLAVPLARVAGFAFHPKVRKRPKNTLAIGIRDGSLIYAVGVQGDQQRIAMNVLFSNEWLPVEIHQIEYLRALDARMVYLSALSPAEYHHVPYLNIPWPLRRDRSVLGLPMSVGGRRYPKGLGMHTASRVTYDLANVRNMPISEKARWPRRFVSSIAVDDAAQGRGSVVFRVALKQGGRWEEAYTSRPICSSEKPLPVVVTLAGATQIALACDYADHGDERDYANWLDARLE